MDTRFWLAVAAYLIPTFPLGYVWHLVIFRDRYRRLEIYRDDMIIPFGLASMLIQALVFAWIYPRAFDTGRDAWSTSALACAGVFGALSWSFTTLPVAAKNRMSSVRGFVGVETAFTAVQFALVSPLIALAWRS